MLDLPSLDSEEPSFVTPKMSFMEYVQFSMDCLHMNSRVTPENCMRLGEENRVDAIFCLSGNGKGDPQEHG